VTRGRLVVGGASIFALAFIWPQSPASAHHPEIRAENVCLEGVPAVAVTATAWETDLEPTRRVNTDVRIDASGPHTAVTLGGNFVAPDYEARVMFQVPNAIGDTLIVRATAVAPWGPNQEFGYAGTWRETTVTIANVCPDGTFGSEERPATTVAAPPTTAAAQGSATPPPVQVLGATVTRVPAQIPAQTGAPRQLAFTGGDNVQLAPYGLTALIGGCLMVAATNRRRGSRVA
jgi:hypothetical protein